MSNNEAFQIQTKIDTEGDRVYVSTIQEGGQVIRLLVGPHGNQDETIALLQSILDPDHK